MSAPGPARPQIYDVCVVGGGPAGSALALRLAQLGRRVALVEKTAFPRAHVGESLSAGIFPLLDVLGVREAVMAAGFLSAAWARVAWAGETRRYQVHGGPGLLVDRGRFDALLLQAAVRATDVQLYQPARVRRAEHRGAIWELALDTGETIRASYVAEATGRASMRMAPQVHGPSRRLLGTDARTVAHYAYWRCEDQREADAGGDHNDTLVESGEDAWYWGANLPGGLFNAMVFVAPGERRDYETLVAQSRLLAPLLRGGQRLSTVLTSDATPSAAITAATMSSIKVGDAALFVDPLSSQGVQTALGTALHAAIVLNTLMDRPQDTELALAFYRRRLQDSADFHATAAAAFYRDQADAIDGKNGSFWRRRVSGTFPPPLPHLSDNGGRHNGPVAPTSRIARADDVRFAPVAVANAHHVTRAEGITTSRKEYAFVNRDVALAPLLAQLEGPMTALDLVARWSRQLPAREALAVLQWAWSENLIGPAATSDTTR